MKECSRNSGRRNAISYPKQLILHPDKALISCVEDAASSRETEVLFTRGEEFKQLLQPRSSINTQRL